MTTIEGTYCPRLKSLRPVLNQWIQLNTRIADSWRPIDVPWWYNERASLSVLAGAVWQCGGIAFEEFSDTKRSVSPKSERFANKYSGRVDIYMEINGHEFKGETKFFWIGASTLWKDQTEYMKWFLDEARRDIRKSRPDGQRRLAIVFATPIVSKKRRTDIKELVTRFVEQVKRLDGDAFAWVFPDLERSISSSKGLFPGAAIIVREVKR